jgi:hypothetical protein
MAKLGRSVDKSGRSEGEARHVRLDYWLLDHPNFLALSANAKVVMIYMAKRFNGFNNNQIGFGWRAGCLVPVNAKEHAERSFGLSRHQIGRALDELEAAKFIVCTKAATFDQKRLTREWRLTWLPMGSRGEKPATKEFASLSPSRNLKARCTGASNPPLQVHQRTYDLEPFAPSDHYRCTSAPIGNSHRCTSAPHLITMGCGGEVIQLRQGKSDAA